MNDTEVYIPKGACVKTIPFKSLSTSMIRKINVHLTHKTSDTPEKHIVTYISPVELREKTSCSGSLDQSSSMTKITPGQFWLPVVSSSLEAYKVLKDILRAHKPRIQLSESKNETDSLPVSRASMQKNSFIILNNQVFLFVKKSRGRRPSFSSQSVSKNQQNSPSRCQTQLVQDSSPKLQQILAAGTTLDSTANLPKPPEDLELNQEEFILQMSNPEPQNLHQSQSLTHTEVTEDPKTAGEGGELEEHLETSGFLPEVESSLAFDFQLLAKEEKISNLRARLRQKEAALNILQSKSTDQV